MRQRVFTIITALALATPAAAAAQDQRTRLDVHAIVERVVDQVRTQGRPRILMGRDGREELTETFKKVVRIGASGEIDITNIAGDIVFVRGTGGEATIEGTKIARGRTQEEAREALELVKVDITERSASRVEVRTNYPGGRDGKNNQRNLSVTVAFTITAPAGTRINAQSVSGSMRAADMVGELSLATISGTVHVTRGKRLAVAKTISGNVEIIDTDSDAGIEAGSISGNILLRHVKAPKIELGNVSGNVVLLDVSCPRLEAQSLSGDVEFTGALASGGRYEFNSHSGNVKLAFTSGTGFEVEATSWSGSIQNDLPMTTRTHQATGGRGPRTKTLRGVVGDGSATLDITTFSGSVWIGKK